MEEREIINQSIDKHLTKSREVQLLYSYEMMKEGKYSVKPSDKKGDILDHWDVSVQKIIGHTIDNEAILDGKRILIDVKNNKDSFDESLGAFRCVLLELRNVRGRKGWLYGKAHGIVFETNDEFLYVRRNDLLKIVRNNVSDWDVDKQQIIKGSKVNNWKVTMPYYSAYELCTRNYFDGKRKDIFVYAPFTDVEPFILHRIKKTITIEELYEKIGNI